MRKFELKKVYIFFFFVVEQLILRVIGVVIVREIIQVKVKVMKIFFEFLCLEYFIG